MMILNFLGFSVLQVAVACSSLEDCTDTYPLLLYRWSVHLNTYDSIVTIDGRNNSELPTGASGFFWLGGPTIWGFATPPPLAFLGVGAKSLGELFKAITLNVHVNDNKKY